MSDREALIPITAEQATLIVPLLRQEAAERRENGDGLILRTGMKQAGFNSHDAASQLLSLADVLDREFPVIDEGDDED